MLRQMRSFRCHLCYPCPSNPLRSITMSDYVFRGRILILKTTLRPVDIKPEEKKMAEAKVKAKAKRAPKKATAKKAATKRVAAKKTVA